MFKMILNFLILPVLFISFVKVSAANNVFGGCDYFQNILIGKMYYIYSPGFEQGNQPYKSNTNCRWSAETTLGYKLALNCTTVVIPSNPDCKTDRLEVSKTGSTNLYDAYRYCGIGTFYIESSENRLVVALQSTDTTEGGYFLCSMVAKPVPPANNCKCGVKQQTRIVGGMPAMTNEFPMMAGLVNMPLIEVYCGATIISSKYALTAAHCLNKKNISQTALFAGSNNYQNYQKHAVLYRISNANIHPNYSEKQGLVRNDIALIETVGHMQFNEGVGPVCLPFKYSIQHESFLNHKVEATGWGATEFGGSVSPELQKTDLVVTSNSKCSLFYPNNVINENNICTYERGKDACQSDSGGPLLYTDNANGLLYVVGIVSYGIGCGTTNPGVNTRITSYLNWIRSMTSNTTFCNV